MIRVAALAGLLLVSLAASADGVDLERSQKIRLKDGAHLIGKVVGSECSDEVLVLREIRTGAKKTVKWADVDDVQAREIRVALGFEVAEEKGGLKLAGVRITNRAGGTFFGVLVNAETAEQEGHYDLKTADGPRRIPIEDVREGPEDVELDATAVYTRQELYERKLAEDGQPETARDHFQMAEFCRLYGPLEAAKRHYERVIELQDPQYPEDTVRRQLARVVKRLESREAEEGLLAIKQKIVFKRFPEAVELIAKFRETYANDVDLLADVQELDQKLADDRAAHFTSMVAGKLRDTIKDLLQKKVRDPDLSLRTAQQYAGGDSSAETSVTHEAVQKVAEKLGVEPKEILTFWEARSRHAVQRAFYGDGTFIVIDNLEDALAKAPKIKTGGPGDKGPKPPKPSPRMKPEEWWERKVQARRYTDLANWLFAWWAEHSGMVQVLPPRETVCPTCAGNGYTQAIHTTSQGSVPFYNRCQTCYEAKHKRVVQFK